MATAQEVIDDLRKEWERLEMLKREASAAEDQAKAAFYRDPNYGTGAVWISRYGDYVDALKTAQTAYMLMDVKRTVENRDGIKVF